MRFLVTGATGFLGRHLTQRLVGDGHEVIAINQSGNKPSDEYWKNVQVFSYTGEPSIFNQIKPVDVVVHLAACLIFDHKASDINPLLDANIKLGAHVLEWMREKHIKNFINISTYAKSIDGISYSPQNLYAATKQMFNTLLTCYVQTYGFKAITLEPFNLYGSENTETKFIDYVFKAAKSREVLKMSQGEKEIAYIHVKDVVNAILIALSRLDTISEYSEEIFSVYDKNEILTLLELVQKVERVIGLQIQTECGVRHYRSREMMKVLPAVPLLPGWEPKISLSNGLEMKWKQFNEI